MDPVLQITQKRVSTESIQPRWRCRQKHLTSLNNQKENNQFKNKEQPELPENHLHGSPTTTQLKKH